MNPNKKIIQIKEKMSSFAKLLKLLIDITKLLLNYYIAILLNY